MRSTLSVTSRKSNAPLSRGFRRLLPLPQPGLGTPGSGDVLAGAIAGLRARGTTDAQAACWGSHLHAAAGDRLASRKGCPGYRARELADELPPLMMELGT